MPNPVEQREDNEKINGIKVAKLDVSDISYPDSPQGREARKEDNKQRC